MKFLVRRMESNALATKMKSVDPVTIPDISSSLVNNKLDMLYKES